MEDIEHLKPEMWQTGKVRFPGLEILVNLPSDKLLWDYGIVDNVKKHASLLTKKMYVDEPISRDAFLVEIESLRKLRGLCIKFEDKNENSTLIRAVIFVRRHRNMNMLTLTYGHESTHALLQLNQEEYLLKALRELGFNLDPIKKYKGDVESIAEIGGWLALERQGKGYKKLSTAEMKSLNNRFDLHYGYDLSRSKMK